jgi:hypothetical protein
MELQTWDSVSDEPEGLHASGTVIFGLLRRHSGKIGGDRGVPFRLEVPAPAAKVEEMRGLSGGRLP